MIKEKIFMRPSKRKNNQLRNISIETNVLNYAEGSCEGSCVIKFRNTHVICSTIFDDTVPRFLKDQNKGRVTAEYGILPSSTN